MAGVTTNLAARVAAAQAAFRQGRYVEACVAFEACAQAGAGVGAWINAGAAAVRGGRAGDGVRLYRAACVAAPDDSRAWHGLAQAAALADEGDVAIEALEHLVRIDGTSEQWFRLAVSYRHRNRHRAARFAYGMILLREPGYLTARFEAMQAIPSPRDDAETERYVREWLRDLEFFESLRDDDPDLVRHRASMLRASTQSHLPALPIATGETQRRYAQLIARWARAEVSSPFAAT